jgi:hypothetical protein
MRPDAEIDRNVGKQYSISIACASASTEEIFGLNDRLHVFKTLAFQGLKIANENPQKCRPVSQIKEKRQSKGRGPQKVTLWRGFSVMKEFIC